MIFCAAPFLTQSSPKVISDSGNSAIAARASSLLGSVPRTRGLIRIASKPVRQPVERKFRSNARIVVLGMSCTGFLFREDLQRSVCSHIQMMAMELVNIACLDVIVFAGHHQEWTEHYVD